MLQVWAPILIVGDLCIPFILQRMSELLPSTAPLETKLKEAESLGNKIAVQIADGDTRNKALKKMPTSQIAVSFFTGTLAPSTHAYPAGLELSRRSSKRDYPPANIFERSFIA